MNYFFWFQKFFKSFLVFLGILLFFSFLITLLYYFNWIPSQVVNVLKLIIIIFSFFTGGFFISKNSKQKGWLEGLKCGGVFLLIMFLFRILILRNGFFWKDFIYYGILLICSILGGMIGINFTTTKK